jgi:hypothetical protein
MEPIYYAYIVIILICLLGGILYSLPVIQEIIRIRRTPTSYLSELQPDEQVEVTGKAESDKTLLSPLTKTPCVWYQASVEKLERAGRDGVNVEHSISIYNDKSTEPFFITDETGKIQVLPDDARYTLNTELDSLDPEVSKALKELGVRIPSLTQVSVFEWIIKPDEQIYVQGKIKYENGMKSFASAEGNPLIISDRSERALLGEHYWRLVKTNIFPLLIIVGIVLLAIYAR